MVKQSKKSKSSKKPFPEARCFGKYIVALGILVAGLLVAVVCLANNQKTHLEQKELEAFQPVAASLVHSLSSEGLNSYLTDIGVTDDDDLYFEYITVKYDGHIPVAHRTQRLHFQCDREVGDETVGCAQAGWAGEWEAVPDEEQALWREYIDLLEQVETTETEEELDALRTQMNVIVEKLFSGND